MSDHDKHADPVPSARREPYEAPRVLETNDFENLAMQCGKAPTTTTFACQNMPSSG